MTAQVYKFTAFDPHADKSYTFTGYQFPNGGVMIPGESTHDSFFDCLENVEANGNDTIESYKNTGKTVEFTDEELREFVDGSAREFGYAAIPTDFESFLTKEIRIQYATDDFFDGCDNMDGVDGDATINAWESLVAEKVEAMFPSADIEIEQIRSGYGYVRVNDRDDSDDARWIKQIMNDAFADESVWVKA